MLLYISQLRRQGINKKATTATLRHSIPLLPLLPSESGGVGSGSDVEGPLRPNLVRPVV